MQRVGRTAGIVVVLALTAALSVACDTARAGTRCRSTAFAQDRSHVLRCVNGRWRRVLTKQQAAQALAAVLRGSAVTPPPSTAPPPTVPVPRAAMPFAERLATIEPARCRNWTPGADLHDCDLTDIGFMRLDASGLPDMGCCLDLRGANLRGARLDRGPLFGVQLDGADLTGASLADTQLRGATFVGARLDGVDLSRADVWSADFSDSSLVRARFTGAHLEHAKFDRADVRGLTSGGVTAGHFLDLVTGLPYLHWLVNGYIVAAGVDLTGADFRNTRLTYAEMRGTTLTRVDVTGALLPEFLIGVTSGGVIGVPANNHNVLHNGYFVTSEARLAGADLRGGQFTNKWLALIDLTGADLRGASFVGSSLPSAGLRGARIDGLDLRGTTLDGADLTGATGSPTVSARTTYVGTICPDGRPAAPTCWDAAPEEPTRPVD